MAKKNSSHIENIDPSEEVTVPVETVKKARKSAQKATTETIESTTSQEEVTEQPEPARKKGRGKWIWLGILIMLVIAALGTGYGYLSAIKARTVAEENQKLEIATTQFVMAQQDQANGNLKMARQRLEYVLQVYPEYPGITDKLAEVMLALSLANSNAAEPQPTLEVVATVVPTKDTSQVSVLFVQAQNQLAASDWPGLLETVNKMRDIDPSYEAIKVDGMYYYALRYNGIRKVNAGRFEPGMYYFAMAERIAPLDVEVESVKAWAQMYQIAASWYGVNWQKAADNFYTLYQQMPNMIDAEGVTAKQRYVNSMEGIGDNLMLIYDYCNAATQYSAAKDILVSDQLLAKIQQAQEYCANPPMTPTPTVDPNAPVPTPTPDSYNPTE